MLKLICCSRFVAVRSGDSLSSLINKGVVSVVVSKLSLGQSVSILMIIQSLSSRCRVLWSRCQVAYSQCPVLLHQCPVS